LSDFSQGYTQVFSDAALELAGDAQPNVSIDELDPQKTRLIVCGTSIGDPPQSLDKRLTIWAREAGVPSLAIIEHWTWLRERFETTNGLLLPDYICLNDQVAFEDAILAKLPPERLIVSGNPRLEALANMARSVEGPSRQASNEMGMEAQGREVLFVSEQVSIPSTFQSFDLEFDEHEVLDSIARCLNPNDKLKIKLHPSESAEKYSYLAGVGEVEVIRNMSLEQMVLRPAFVIGMHSMLLLELSLFRSDVISYLPGTRLTFIGNRLNLTHLVSSHSEIERVLNGSPKNVRRETNMFEGSKRKFQNLLRELSNR
jgi:hypothetical protein